MKKTRNIIVCVVILLTLTVGLLTGCDLPVDHEEGFKQLKENLKTSIGYEIFYSKELIRDNDNTEITRVNSVCSIDKKNQFEKNPDGSYLNHGVSIYHEKDGQMQSEIIVGLSKINKKDLGKNLKFTTTFTGKNEKNEAQFTRTMANMTAGEYIKSEEFTRNTLAVKLAELDRLNREDVIFDSKKGVTRTGELTNIKFKLTDSYFANYRADMGKESILNGAYVAIELVYGRVARVVVMEEEKNTDSIFGIAEYEAYKLEIVYLGPKISIPKYNEVDSSKNNVWTEVIN